jgi:type II secretory pathway pseudopilin PulG
MQEKSSNTPIVNPTFKTPRALRNGLTLVELVVAMLVTIISLLGVSSAYVSGRKQIIKQSQYQQAVELTCGKLEEMKAQGYSALVVDEDEGQDPGEEIPVSGLTYVRYTSTELTATPTAQVPNPCKKLTVTVQWTSLASDQHEVKLITYIGP